jgi:hypothetical protein
LTASGSTTSLGRREGARDFAFMGNRVRRRLWQMLGGATDRQGNPRAEPTDWREVFEGAPDDAAEVTAALRYASVETASRTYVPARFYGWPEPARTVVSVRVAEAARAEAFIESLPHVGNALAVTARGDLYRPHGLGALVEFATSAEADKAMAALGEAEIRAVVTAPLEDGLDDVGFVISVRLDDLWAGAEVIRHLAATDESDSLYPLDLADVEQPPRNNPTVPTLRVAWLAWTFLAVMLAVVAGTFIIFGLVSVFRGTPSGVLYLLGGVALGYATWQSGRRSAALDRET